mmetsp:Transcript_83019/g.166098  ORF Transcript_83019/g.166098 Transcript_83019/m.166098 type:complete len:219 (-) Transcript_83019:3616-4272(-)
MACASASCAPLTLDALVRSQPAKSTSCSFDVVVAAPPTSPVVAVSIRSVTTKWLRLLCAFKSCAAVARFSLAMDRISSVVAASGTSSSMAFGTATPPALVTRRSTFGGPLLGCGSTSKSRTHSLYTSSTVRNTVCVRTPLTTTSVAAAWVEEVEEGAAAANPRAALFCGVAACTKSSAMVRGITPASSGRGSTTTPPVSVGQGSSPTNVCVLPEPVCP